MFRSERLAGMPDADASSPERAPPSRVGSGGNCPEFRRTTFSGEGSRGSELDRGACLKLAAPHLRALAECTWADTRQNFVADENRIFVACHLKIPDTVPSIIQTTKPLPCPPLYRDLACVVILFLNLLRA